jgi:hypothetical protein
MQGGVPVLLFYGHVPTDDFVTVDLDSRFDYVLTSIIVSSDAPGETSAMVMSDESSNALVWFSGPGSVENAANPVAWGGYLPIVGVTSLRLQCVANPLYCSIGGLLVAPSFADTVPPPV